MQIYKNMQIIKEEIKKTSDIFKVLELSENETKEHLKNLENALLMDMAAEAFAEKGQDLEGTSFSAEDVEDFLLDNYDEKAIEEIFSRISRDVVVEYFSKILKNVDEEKVVKVNEILTAKFE
jgi:hypothetical protein